MRKRNLFVLVFFVFAITPQWGHAVCGDFNGDVNVNIQDLVGYVDFLWAGGVGPAVYTDADIDDYQVITGLDLMLLLHYTYIGGVTPTCPPTLTPLSGPISPAHVLSLTSYTFPQGQTSMNIQFQLTTNTGFVYMDLPLKIDVNGQSPTIGTITIDPALNAWTNLGQTYGPAGSGKVLFTLGNYAGTPIGPFTNKLMATVTISLPSAPSTNLPITLSWDYSCPPVVTGYGSSHYPILAKNFPKSGWDAIEAVTPTLQTSGHAVPGITFWGIVILACLLIGTAIWVSVKRLRLFA